MRKQRKTIFINHDEWTIADYYQRTRPNHHSKTQEADFHVYDQIGMHKGKHPESVARLMVSEYDDWTMASAVW